MWSAACRARLAVSSGSNCGSSEGFGHGGFVLGRLLRGRARLTLVFGGISGVGRVLPHVGRAVDGNAGRSSHWVTSGCTKFRKRLARRAFESRRMSEPGRSLIV